MEQQKRDKEEEKRKTYDVSKMSLGYQSLTAKCSPVVKNLRWGEGITRTNEVISTRRAITSGDSSFKGGYVYKLLGDTETS